jgi:hypothetical protein
MAFSEYVHEASVVLTPHFEVARDKALLLGSSILATPQADQAITLFQKYCTELGNVLPVIEGFSPKAVCITGNSCIN